MTLTGIGGTIWAIAQRNGTTPWPNEPATANTTTTRAQRYDARLTKPYDELVTFYDAVAPRAEEAIAHLNALDINALPADAVNVFKQNRIPDSGAAFSDMVAEPAV